MAHQANIPLCSRFWTKKKTLNNNATIGHISCDTCRKNWSKFTTLTSGQGCPSTFFKGNSLVDDVRKQHVHVRNVDVEVAINQWVESVGDVKLNEVSHSFMTWKRVAIFVCSFSRMCCGGFDFCREKFFKRKCNPWSFCEVSNFYYRLNLSSQWKRL